MKKRSIFTPILIGAALLSLVILFAVTDIFQPLILFIHTGEITLIQALWCFLAALVAFALVLILLIMLGRYFLPEIENHQRKDE